MSNEPLQIKKAQKWAKILGRCPGVMAIFLSGSLSQGKATEQSDIDFFIIAREDQIWTARFFVFLVLKLCWQIATEKDHASKICPNHFITHQHLEIQEQDEYAANLFSHNIPLYDPFSLWSEFVEANKSWIEGFGYTFFLPLEQGEMPDRAEGIECSISRHSTNTWAECMFKSLQTQKIKSNPNYKHPRAKIVLEDHELRFHPKPKNTPPLLKSMRILIFLLIAKSSCSFLSWQVAPPDSSLQYYVLTDLQ